MANKAKDNKNKNLIIGICAAVVVVVVIVVAIVLATRGTQLNDSYFVSDGTKYVLTMEADSTSDESSPTKTHIVYFYSGDDVTGLNYYYEFADENGAKAAYEQITKEESDDTFKEVNRDGKYIVLIANESEYKDLTASDVKQQIEFMETLKNMGTSSVTTDTDNSDTVTIDNVDVEEEEE